MTDPSESAEPTEFPDQQTLDDGMGAVRHALDTTSQWIAPERLAYELRRLADELDPPDEYLEARRAWSCLIGYTDSDLPSGCDAPMRKAVESAYFDLTGQEAVFVFSGWGATLSGVQRRSLRDVEPPLDLGQSGASAEAYEPEGKS